MKKSILISAVLFLLATSVFAATSGSGRKSVTTAGTAVVLSTTEQRFTQLTVCADPDNGGLISVGKTPVASTTVPEGVQLAADDCYTIESQYIKLSDVKINSTVDGESVTYEWQYL